MNDLIKKFKARGIDNFGILHTGWLTVYFVNDALKTYIQEEQIDDKPAMTYAVKPESVSRFVNDVDGKEIYEDDLEDIEIYATFEGRKLNLSNHPPA